MGVTPSGETYDVATKQVGGDEYQQVQPVFGGSGVATPVSTDNPLPVTIPEASANDYFVDVARGLVTGHSLVHVFGENPDIDAGLEDLWGGGGDYTGFDATTAETVDVTSSSANDTAAGTGARTVRLYGLDGSLAEQTEDITMNGTSDVVSANTYLRLDKVMVLTAGSGGENAGAITVHQTTTTANVFAEVPAGFNHSMISAYTIPAGKTGFFLDWFVEMAGGNNASSQCRLRVRPSGGVFNVKEVVALEDGGDTAIHRPYKAPKNSLAAGSDIVISADSDTANAAISGGYTLLLIDD